MLYENIREFYLLVKMITKISIGYIAATKYGKTFPNMAKNCYRLCQKEP